MYLPAGNWATPSWVSPFGYQGIYACLRLPLAFRSLPRPSSALGALASTLCSSLLNSRARMSFDIVDPETNRFLICSSVRPVSSLSQIFHSSFTDQSQLVFKDFSLFSSLPCAVVKVHGRFPVPFSRVSLEWWVAMDSNHRPHAYQACALTT